MGVRPVDVRLRGRRRASSASTSRAAARTSARIDARRRLRRDRHALLLAARAARRDDGFAACFAASEREGEALVRFDLASASLHRAAPRQRHRVRRRRPLDRRADRVPDRGRPAPRMPSSMRRATPRFVGEPGTRPPLLVISHGGPTGVNNAALGPRLQYWTQRGFAVVDVNYGGSSGYGRAYRERLDGRWGVVDVDDVVNAARFLVARGDVDPQRLAIRGASAGGYTTLAALAFRDALPGRRQPLRHQRPRDAGARHPQVRVALPRFAGRPLPGARRPVPRALAGELRRPAVERPDPVPGRRGPGRAAEPGRGDVRGGAGQGPAGRLPAVRRRAARLSPGEEHPPRARGRAGVLRPGVRLRAGRCDRAGRDREPATTADAKRGRFASSQLRGALGAMVAAFSWRSGATGDEDHLANPLAAAGHRRLPRRCRGRPVRGVAHRIASTSSTAARAIRPATSA